VVGQCKACGAEECFLRLMLRSGVELGVETKQASFTPYLILLQSDRSQSISFAFHFLTPKLPKALMV
jgi:hypothetical protein